MRSHTCPFPLPAPPPFDELLDPRNPARAGPAVQTLPSGPLKDLACAWVLVESTLSGHPWPPLAAPHGPLDVLLPRCRTVRESLRMSPLGAARSYLQRVRGIERRQRRWVRGVQALPPERARDVASHLDRRGGPLDYARAACILKRAVVNPEEDSDALIWAGGLLARGGEWSLAEPVLMDAIQRFDPHDTLPLRELCLDHAVETGDSAAFRFHFDEIGRSGAGYPWFPYDPQGQNTRYRQALALGCSEIAEHLAGLLRHHWHREPD